jgi:hypothetical protein
VSRGPAVLRALGASKSRQCQATVECPRRRGLQPARIKSASLRRATNRRRSATDRFLDDINNSRKITKSSIDQSGTSLAAISQVGEMGYVFIILYLLRQALTGLLLHIPKNHLHLLALDLPHESLDELAEHLWRLVRPFRRQFPASPPGGPDHFLHFAARVETGENTNRGQCTPSRARSISCMEHQAGDANLLDCSSFAIRMGRSADDTKYYIRHRDITCAIADRSPQGRLGCHDRARLPVDL